MGGSHIPTFWLLLQGIYRSVTGILISWLWRLCRYHTLSVQVSKYEGASEGSSGLSLILQEVPFGSHSVILSNTETLDALHWGAWDHVTPEHRNTDQYIDDFLLKDHVYAVRSCPGHHEATCTRSLFLPGTAARGCHATNPSCCR